MAQPKLTEIKLKSDKFYPLLDMIYPIGAIYWSKNNTSPASLFGGTWVQIVEDRFPLFGNDDTTGGSRTVSISVANLPSHSHSTGLGNTGGGRTDWGLVGEGAWGGHVLLRNGTGNSIATSATGSGTALTIPWQPWRYYYAWRRTA